MTRLVNVETCTLRRDEKYLISYRIAGEIHSAISARPVRVGSDVRVRDGKVV